MLGSHHMVFHADGRPPSVPSETELAERLAAMRRRNRGQAQRRREKAREAAASSRARSRSPALLVAGPSSLPGVAAGSSAMADPVCAGVDLDIDSDVDLEALVGPLLDLSGDEMWMSGEEEATPVVADVPAWHSEWVVAIFEPPPPAEVELLPLAVGVQELANFVLAVQDAGWRVAAKQSQMRFRFREDDMPMIRLAVQLLCLGRRNTSVAALRVMQEGLAGDPSGVAALILTANFLGHLGNL